MSESLPSPKLHMAGKAYHIVAEVIGWKSAIDFGLRVWSEKRPPSSGPADPIHGGGHGVIYIPKAIKGDYGRELVRLAGAENAQRLVSALGGENFEFPSLVRLSRRRRDQAIAEQVANGWSVESVAWSHDMTPRNVRRICSEQGIDVRAARQSYRAKHAEAISSGALAP